MLLQIEQAEETGQPGNRGIVATGDGLAHHAVPMVSRTQFMESVPSGSHLLLDDRLSDQVASAIEHQFSRTGLDDETYQATVSALGLRDLTERQVALLGDNWRAISGIIHTTVYALLSALDSAVQASAELQLLTTGERGMPRDSLESAIELGRHIHRVAFGVVTQVEEHVESKMAPEQAEVRRSMRTIGHKFLEAHSTKLAGLPHRLAGKDAMDAEGLGGLKIDDLLLMMAMEYREGMTPTEISHFTGNSTAAATGAKDKLQKYGMIRGEFRAGGDRRKLPLWVGRTQSWKQDKKIPGKLPTPEAVLGQVSAQLFGSEPSDEMRRFTSDVLVRLVSRVDSVFESLSGFDDIEGLSSSNGNTDSTPSLRDFLVIASIVGDPEHAQQRYSQTELSKMLGISTAAVTGMRDKLVKLGFAVPEEDEKDRRTKVPILTAKGYHFYNRMVQELMLIMESYIVEQPANNPADAPVRRSEDDSAEVELMYHAIADELTKHEVEDESGGNG